MEDEIFGEPGFLADHFGEDNPVNLPVDDDDLLEEVLENYEDTIIEWDPLDEDEVYKVKINVLGKVMYSLEVDKAETVAAFFRDLIDKLNNFPGKRLEEFLKKEGCDIEGKCIRDLVEGDVIEYFEQGDAREVAVLGKFQEEELKADA